MERYYHANLSRDRFNQIVDDTLQIRDDVRTIALHGRGHNTGLNGYGNLS